jgi:glutathione S-transferase
MRRVKILYHCISARSFRPLWTLEELELTYQIIMLPFPPRACSPEYMDINPLGTVPAYIDGTTRMTESAAICEFIAMRHSLGDLAIAPDESEYGEYLNWVHFGEATLTFPQTLVLRYGRFEPIDRQLPQVVQDYSRWFLSRLRGVERKVSSHRYLCADRFTVADISVGYALMLAGYLGLSDRFPDAVRAYWAELQERDGFKKALAAQEKAAVEQGVSTTPAPLTF